MTHLPVLTLLMLLPILGVASLFVFAGGNSEAAANRARIIGLITTTITFAASLLWLFPHFDNSTAAFQFVEKHEFGYC